MHPCACVYKDVKHIIYTRNILQTNEHFIRADFLGDNLAACYLKFSE